ncbi:MAG: hypothetical protein CL759_07280 [Chloroflexi bacterium]|nr:hypothetical protein [Chloroflexota bacterium]MQF95439.1 response regulator [SAR202 cluster bacterium]|tara:strand:+ start:1273 stop:2745 length:1473 start_codon:yes stop_codon:yes gene_type:complete
MTKILVVDDDSRIRMLVTAELTAVGYETVEAENGAVALERVYTQQPDLVILDQIMPVMEGLEVLKVFKHNDQTAQIPVILLTAEAAIDNEEKALDLGATHYVSKPWRIGTIPAVIRVAFREAGRPDLIVEQKQVNKKAPAKNVSGDGPGDATPPGLAADDDGGGVAETTSSAAGIERSANPNIKTVAAKPAGEPAVNVKKVERSEVQDTPPMDGDPDTVDPGPRDEVVTEAENRPETPFTFDWGEDIINPPKSVEVEKYDSVFLSTGNPLLDLKLSGGVPREGLSCIEGGPSTGKSVLSQHFAHAGLNGGYRVSYLCSQRSPAALVTQFASLGMDPAAHVADGRLNICAIPLRDSTGRKTGGLAELVGHIVAGLSEAQFVIIDDLTGIVTGEQEEAVINFLEKCKALGNAGHSIVIAANPDSMADGGLLSVRSLADVYLGLEAEKTGSRINNVLEVFKVSNAEAMTGNRVNFNIEPGLGIRISAISKASG